MQEASMEWVDIEEAGRADDVTGGRCIGWLK